MVVLVAVDLRPRQEGQNKGNGVQNVHGNEDSSVPFSDDISTMELVLIYEKGEHEENNVVGSQEHEEKHDNVFLSIVEDKEAHHLKALRE